MSNKAIQCSLASMHAKSISFIPTWMAFSFQIEKEEQAAAEKAVTKEEFQGEWTAPAPEFTAPPQPEVADWSEGVQVPSVPIQPFPAGKYIRNRIEGKDPGG